MFMNPERVAAVLACCDIGSTIVKTTCPSITVRTACVGLTHKPSIAIVDIKTTNKQSSHSVLQLSLIFYSAMASSKRFQPLCQVSRSFDKLPTQCSSSRIASRRSMATIANFKVPTINNEPNVSSSKAFSANCPTDTSYSNITQRDPPRDRSFKLL
jgi:hypothetical protein